MTTTFFAYLSAIFWTSALLMSSPLLGMVSPGVYISKYITLDLEVMVRTRSFGYHSFKQSVVLLQDGTVEEKVRKISFLEMLLILKR